MLLRPKARCLKITEKVSFNIASEASYVYILSGQKLIKNAQKWSILASLWKHEGCGQTVLPDRSVLIGQTLVENAKIQKFKCDILSNFQTMWLRVLINTNWPDANVLSATFACSSSILRVQCLYL